MSSMDSHKVAAPAPFLTKTYQLVDDPCSNHIVSWGEDDTTFVVWRPPEFARDLLPKYFKHNNFSSFVRQLNTYGFKKIVADRWEFANENFRRGEKHLLSEIHRRKASQTPHHYYYHPPQGSHHQSPSAAAATPPPPYYYSTAQVQNSWALDPPLLQIVDAAEADDEADYLSALSHENQRLRERNSLLLSELSHMKKLYTDIVYFIQHHITPVTPPPPPPPPPHHQINPRPAATRLTEMASDGGDEMLLTDEMKPRPADHDHDCRLKLFGVAINDGKKRSLNSEDTSPHEDSKIELGYLQI